MAELASGSVESRPPPSTRPNGPCTSPPIVQGASGFDIYVSTRPAVNAPWEAPVPAPGINTADGDADPFIAGGDLLLFLTRVGSGDRGNIYWSARRSTTEPWSPAVPLEGINAPSYDSDAALSPDLSYLMFSSMRTGNGGVPEAHALLDIRGIVARRLEALRRVRSGPRRPIVG